MGMGRIIIAAGLTGSLFTGCMVDAEQPVGHPPGDTPLFSSSAETGPVSALGIRSRTATVDNALFGVQMGPLDQPQENLHLNLFADVRLLASRTRWTHLPNNGWSWHGVVPGDQYSEVTLVQNDGFVSGNIRTSDGDYQIRSQSGGNLTLEEVDLSRLPGDDDAALPDGFEDWKESESDAGPSASGDAETLVDVLVVYTQAALNGAGSKSALESEIMLAISETNEGYTQSKVAHRLRLADAVMTDWDETEGSFDFYSTLKKATDNGDGAMDEIHAIRNEVGADEVVVIVEGDNSYCGIAWLMSKPSPYFSESAFAVVARGCATGNYTFAHELGHNMGSNHDHDNADSAAYEYSYGLQVPDAGVRTIMAYSCPTTYCRRINRWSNPDTSWEGHALGKPSTESDAADNHKSLNNTASIVAAFRDVPEVPTPSTPEVVVPAPGTHLTGPSATFILTDVEAEQYAIHIGSTLGSAELGQYDLGTATTQLVTEIPEDGRTLYVRAWARHGTDWVYSDSTYTANKLEEVASQAPTLTSPTSGEVLPGTSATFKWTSSKATQIVVRLGREPADASLGQYGVGTATSFTARHLPTDGEPVWVSLYAFIDGKWNVDFYDFETDDRQESFEPAQMLAPADGLEIATNAQFRWSTPCNCDYRLTVVDGTGTILHDTGETKDKGVDISELPTGSQINATLYTLSEGRVFAREYAYRVR